MYIGVEIDIHRQLETLDRVLIYALTNTDGMIVDQNVDGSLLSHDLGPELLSALDISQVALVEVNVLEPSIVSELAYIV